MDREGRLIRAIMMEQQIVHDHLGDDFVGSFNDLNWLLETCYQTLMSLIGTRHIKRQHMTRSLNQISSIFASRYMDSVALVENLTAMYARPWFFGDKLLLFVNGCMMALLVGIYSAALQYGVWPDRQSALYVSLPFISVTYAVGVCACLHAAMAAWRLRRQHQTGAMVRKRRAANIWWSTANAIVGPAVFVTLSWMDTATAAQRHLSYSTQMCVAIFTAVSIYVTHGVAVASMRSSEEEKFEQGHAGSSANYQNLPPVSEFATLWCKDPNHFKCSNENIRAAVRIPVHASSQNCMIHCFLMDEELVQTRRERNRESASRYRARRDMYENILRQRVWDLLNHVESLYNILQDKQIEVPERLREDWEKLKDGPPAKPRPPIQDRRGIGGCPPKYREKT